MSPALASAPPARTAPHLGPAGQRPSSRRARLRLLGAALLALLAVPIAGCPEEARARLNDPCGENAECESGLCLEGICLDPMGDEDGDLLLNGREGALGTNPLSRDSDGDGEGDLEEVGPDEPLDGDGDGLIDAIESNAPAADGDRDCLPDEVDPQNNVFDQENDRLVLRWCRVEGVCGAEIENVFAVCDRDLVGDEEAVDCDYSRIATYEDFESRCDDLDNDCDGGTDEELDEVEGTEDICPRVGVCAAFAGTPLASCDEGGWVCAYDGVPDFEEGTERSCDGLDNDCDGATDEDFAYTEGGVALGLGDACGLGACAGGQVVCAADGASVTCSTVAAAVETCDGTDDDCDGLTDEDFDLGGVTVGGACSGTGACSAERGVVECATPAAAMCSVDAGGSDDAGTPEVCDAVDNDCDGATDEDPVAEPGGAPVCPPFGVCEGVAFVFCDEANEPRCDTTQVDGYEEVESSCDGEDNDCDGLVDEEVDKIFEGAPAPVDWGVPATRAGYAAAVAPERGVLVLAGGAAPWWNPFADEIGLPPAQADTVDTWELDLETGAWLPQALGGARPPARAGAWMVHDPANGRMLMGSGTSGPDGAGTWHDDVWAYDLEAHAWTELTAAGGAAPQVERAAAVVVAPEGEAAELWVLSGGRPGGAGPYAWRASLDDPTTFVEVDLGATALPGAAAAWSAAGDRIVVFGGALPPDDSAEVVIVELGGPTPTLGGPTPGGVVPPGQAGSALVADPRDNGQFLLYGARPGGEAATYILIPDGVADPGAWTWQSYPVDETNPPPPRRTAAVTAVGEGRVHVWLGLSPVGLLRRDAWSLDPAQQRWRRDALAPAFPPQRRGAASAVDPDALAWYVYGGATQTSDGFVPRDDLWRFDLRAGTWEQLAQTGGARPDTVLAASVLDVEGQRLFVFGGTRVTTEGALDFQAGVDALWVLDLATNAWSSLSLVAGGGPTSLVGHTATLTPDGSGALVYGGYAGGAPVDDLWRYDFDSGLWTALTPAGDPPAPRAAHGAFVDPARGHLVVVGGEGAGGAIGVYDIESGIWTEHASDLPDRSAIVVSGYDPWAAEAAIIALDLDGNFPFYAWKRIDVTDLASPVTRDWVGADVAREALFFAPVVADPAGRGLLGLAGTDLLDRAPHGLWRFPQICP